MVFSHKKYLALSLLALQLAAASEDARSPLTPIDLVAPDGSVKATFIPLGATLTNFYVKDKKGTPRDIVLGFDDTHLYQSDVKGHPYFGAVVGRYANRIRNGTFTIPISKNASGPGKKYYITQNERNNTLHSGALGFDRRNFTVHEATKSSLTLTMIDPAGTDGFPGQINTTVVYKLLPDATFSMVIHASASADSPIMLSGHHYWNLEAYQESEDLGAHQVQIQSSKYVETDPALIPTGKISSVQGNPMDFRTTKSLGKSIPSTSTAAYCGANCTGFDNCWIFDSAKANHGPSFSTWNSNSGIRMDLYTNQRAIQMYTCNGVYNASNPIPRKQSQGGPTHNYLDHSCIAVEPQDLIDGINNPEFGVDQIYGPGRDYLWSTTYKFSTVNADGH